MPVPDKKFKALMKRSNENITSIQRGVTDVDKYIAITREEYAELKEDQKFLNHLRANGVDNWEGYGGFGDDDDDESEGE